MAAIVQINLNDQQAVDGLKAIGEEFLRTGKAADNLSEHARMLLDELKGRNAARAKEQIGKIADEIERTRGKTGDLSRTMGALRPVLANTFGNVVNDVADLGQLLKEAGTNARSLLGTTVGGIGAGLAAAVVTAVSVRSIYKDLTKETADIGENHFEIVRSTADWLQYLGVGDGTVAKLNEEFKETTKLYEKMAEQSDIAHRNIRAAAKAEEEARAGRDRFKDIRSSIPGSDPNALGPGLKERFETLKEVRDEEERLVALAEKLSKTESLSAEKAEAIQKQLLELADRRRQIDETHAKQTERRLAAEEIIKTIVRSNAEIEERRAEHAKQAADTLIEQSEDRSAVEKLLGDRQVEYQTKISALSEKIAELLADIEEKKKRNNLTDQDNRKTAEELSDLEKKRSEAVEALFQTEQKRAAFNKQQQDDEKRRLEELFNAHKELQEQARQAANEARQNRVAAIAGAFRGQQGGQQGGPNAARDFLNAINPRDVQRNVLEAKLQELNAGRDMRLAGLEGNALAREQRRIAAQERNIRRDVAQGVIGGRGGIQQEDVAKALQEAANVRINQIADQKKMNADVVAGFREAVNAEAGLVNLTEQMQKDVDALKKMQDRLLQMIQRAERRGAQVRNR